jgi:hypothetical protein
MRACLRRRRRKESIGAAKQMNNVVIMPMKASVVMGVAGMTLYLPVRQWLRETADEKGERILSAACGAMVSRNNHRNAT